MLLATLINIRAPFRWSPRLMCILLKNECIWIRTRNIKFERPYFDTFSTSNVFYEPVCGILRARFSCHFVQKFMPTYSRPFEFWRIIIWYKQFFKTPYFQKRQRLFRKRNTIQQQSNLDTLVEGKQETYSLSKVKDFRAELMRYCCKLKVFFIKKCHLKHL